MKVGIIGAGNWGSRVVPEYITLKEDGAIDAVGVCDNRSDILNNYRKNEGVDIVEGDYEQFIQQMDAVHICAGNRMHYPIAHHALSNDVNVLMEKPMTKEVSKAQTLTEMALEKGLILQVGHIFRFANVINKVRELQNNGFFGDISYLTMQWTTHWMPSQESDIVWDLLPHPIDIIHFVTGRWPMEGKIMQRSYRKKTKNDLAIALIDYGDFIANIELSWITRQRKRLLKVVGSNVTASVEAVAQEITIYDEDKTYDLNIKDNNTILAEASNFVQSINQGTMRYNSAFIGMETVRAITELERI